jgi:hypothetical protein
MDALLGLEVALRRSVVCCPHWQEVGWPAVSDITHVADGTISLVTLWRQ